MIRNVIFDWSGTLVDDLPAVWQATNFVLRQSGVAEMTLDQFRAEFCLPFRIFYERWTPAMSMEQLEEWFHASFREVQHSVVELPHAREFLEFCSEKKLRLFVLSTVRQEYYTTQAEGCGFHQFMERAYLQILNKQEQIHQLLTENNLRPEETLFVGDMEHDIATARHGGVHSCGVLTGYNTLPQLRAANPDLIVEHLGELRDILQHGNLEIPGAVSEKSSARFPLATVGALIFRPSGEVLMVRTAKWSNRWGIPGGKIKFGESSIDALIRELKEETNLDVKNIQFVLVQDCIRSKEFYRDEHFVLLNYTCECEQNAPVTLNDEAFDYKWVTLEEAGQMDLNNPTRVLLEDVVKRKGACG